MNITCAKCHSLLEVNDAALKAGVVCPVCNTKVEVLRDAATGGESQTPSCRRLERPKGFNVLEFFSDVFKRHDDSEIENYFMVGTAKTTPDIFEVDLKWPKPWVFARLLVAGIAIYYVLTALWGYWLGKGQYDILSIPDMLIMGAFAVPLASAVLFFEMNSRRNVSLYQVIKLIVAGGILSLVLTDFFNVARPWLIGIFGIPEAWQASVAGPVEEAAKLAAVLLIVRGTKYRYTLNGLLFGASVGVGFAMFETAGYALREFLSSFAVALGNGTLELARSGKLNDAAFHGGVYLESLKPAVTKLNEVIVLRGLLAPFGHVAYSAIAVGALWRVKGGERFTWAMLKDARFLGLFAVAVALHAFWNSPLFPSDGFPWIKVAVVVVIGWGLIFSLVQDGLRQIRKEQNDVVNAD